MQVLGVDEDAGQGGSLRLGDDRIAVLVSRRAAAKQPERLRAGIPELVFLAG